MKRTVLGWGAMCCVVLNAPHIFMYCTFRDAPVDALMDILRRDVASQVLVLVYLLTTSRLCSR